VPIPENVRAPVSFGGKLSGARTIVVGTPASSRCCQKNFPRTRFSVPPGDQGIRYPKNHMKSSGGSVRAVDMIGVTPVRPIRRWMKSKIPCPPGSRPVMKFAQATGLSGGSEVPRGR